MITPPLFQTITFTQRPNRIEEKKNEDYHRRYARYTLSSVANPLHQDFVYRSIIYWAFYNNFQWLFNEDLKAFLGDESGADRNRIKLTQNVIKPWVDQRVGEVGEMEFNARAEAVSEQAFNRREMALERLKFYSWAAEMNPQAKEYIQNRVPIGEDEMDTEKNFENLWQDNYVKAINYLIEAIKDKQDFEMKKEVDAKFMAINGMAIEKGYYMNGEQVWETIDPIYFGFDHTAKRPDLKDAGYMWHCNLMLDTDIFERFQNITTDQRRLISAYTSLAPAGMDSMLQTVFGTAGRIPVYETYWKDIEKQEYGYVMDPYGYPLFTQVNKKNEEGEIEGYTSDDLIDPPKNEFGTKIIRETSPNNDIVIKEVTRKSKFIYVDVLRYCIFIPGEIAGGQLGSTAATGTENEVTSSPNSKADIVLEYGKAAFQETYCLDPSSVEFPFKVYCVSYHEGYVLSPIETAISPQRFINRLTSVAENQINNTRGSNVFYDGSFIDSQGGESEMLRNMNLSKPVRLSGKGRPLNNAVIPYGTDAGNSEVWFKLANEIKQIVNDVTGVNKDMQGSANSPDQLVGVQQNNIQRGTITLQPYYFAIRKLMLQCYQSMATQGKRIYAHSQRKLSIMVGDIAAYRLTITEDFNIEDFRINIVETGTKRNLIAEANAELLQLYQLGFVTKNVLVKYYGVSTKADIRAALQESKKEQALLSKMQNDQTANRTNAALQATGQATDEERQHEFDMQNLKNKGKLQDTIIKTFGKQQSPENAVLK